MNTIDWSQVLLSALPHAVTIFTVITTTIIQLRSSKRETARFIAQLEQQKELERIQHDEERKRIILENQLKNQDKIQSERIMAYSNLLESLYCIESSADVTRSCTDALAKSVKLLSLCNPSDALAVRVKALVDYLEYELIPGKEITKQDICSIKSYASSIALYLNNPNFGRSEVASNDQLEQLQR